MSISYLCPATDTPVGGIKVMYRHSEMLSRHGIASDVCHPHDPAFACSWFAHAATLRRDHSFDVQSDFLVIPEIWAAPFAARCLAVGLRYAVFVQNGYRIYQGADERGEAGLEQAYAGASLVLSISHDTTRLLQRKYPGLPGERLLRLLPGVGEAFGVAPRKRRQIAYMPRKLPEHAANVCFLLRGVLGEGWSLRAIDGLAEPQVAAVLAESAIFLSFSELEGLSLPPMEAALSGNLVVGYTGQGSGEYFEQPLFREVVRGDIPGFVDAVRQAMHDVDSGLLGSQAVGAQVRSLAARYSSRSAQDLVLAFGRRVAGLLGGGPPQAPQTMF